MRAKDIMSSPVITVGPDTPLKHVATLFVEHDISAVPVLDAAGEIAGIVTEADLISLEAGPEEAHLLKRVPREGPIPRTAGEAMSRDLVTMDGGTDVTHIAKVMLQRRLRHVIIMAGKAVIGIVSRRDLIKSLARSDLEIRVELEELLDDELLMLGRFRAEVADGIVTLTGPREAAGRQLAKLLAKSVPGVIAVQFAEPSGAKAEAS